MVQGQLRQKKFMKPHLNRKKQGMVACACHPSYRGSINKRIMVQMGPKQKSKTPTPK
jgi:hypothetical protein